MDNDDRGKGEGELKIISLVDRIKRYTVRDWVRAIPGMPPQEVLQETTIILGCITGLTHQALRQPKEAQTLMRATYYLSGMVKAMIEGQLPGNQAEEGDREP